MNLLNKPNNWFYRVTYARKEARLVNPVKVFSMKDPQVVRDAIFFLKVGL